MFRSGVLGGTRGFGPEPIELHMALRETSHPLATFFSVYVCFHTDSMSTAVHFQRIIKLPKYILMISLGMAFNFHLHPTCLVFTPCLGLQVYTHTPATPTAECYQSIRRELFPPYPLSLLDEEQNVFRIKPQVQLFNPTTSTPSQGFAWLQTSQNPMFHQIPPKPQTRGFCYLSWMIVMLSLFSHRALHFITNHKFRTVYSIWKC